ncbi:MAG: hypothetical protein ABSB97_03865 [Thermoplasmata archaeon]
MPSAWRRDYRLSLAILVAGIVVIVAFSVFVSWAYLTGNYPASFGAGLALNLIGTAGLSLIMVGVIFAFHNWSLLRQTRRNARPGPPG